MPRRGIGVDLVDELLDGLPAIADNMAGHTLRRRYQNVPLNNQQAVIEAADEALHQDGAAVLAGVFIGFGDCVRRLTD